MSKYSDFIIIHIQGTVNVLTFDDILSYAVTVEI
jgi:hypothetical protein